MESPEKDHSRGLQKLLSWIEKSGSDPAAFSAVSLSFKAYDLAKPIVGVNSWVWLREYAGFRNSEYFAPFMNELGAPAYWRKNGFPPACRPLAGDDFECD